MAVELRTIAGPHAGLIDWLAGHRVEYELREHPETYTAEATARAEHTDPRRFAKVVGVAAADGRHVLLVVDAPDHVDLAKARRLLGTAGTHRFTVHVDRQSWERASGVAWADLAQDDGQPARSR